MAAAGLRRVQTRTWPAVVDDLVDRHYAEVLREAAAAAVRRAA
jgi:phosphatidylinositol alpha 1,6-mannosyltransferase